MYKSENEWSRDDFTVKRIAEEVHWHKEQKVGIS